MRTTIDLPTGIHRRAKAIADRDHRSLSAVISEMAAIGLNHVDEQVHEITIDPVSGWPTIDTGGGPVTSEDVARLIDEDE